MFTLQPTDALLVIDMQNDFLPGGPLGVPEGDTIIPGLNALAARFDHVILTQDWHPGGHISFASTHVGKRPFTDTVDAPYGPQTLWPDHTIQGSRGAQLADALDMPHAELILRKGFRGAIDSYSAFLENDRTTGTGLTGFLRERGLTRLFFSGLAYDFCVGFSALDAVRLGFEAIVVEDLSRGVGLPGTATQRGSIDAMRACFEAGGVQQIHAKDLAGPAARAD